MTEWLENWKIRFEVWRFNRRAVEVTIRRSCGHEESGPVLPEWIEGRRNSPCPECAFYFAMAEAREKRSS